MERKAVLEMVKQLSFKEKSQSLQPYDMNEKFVSNSDDSNDEWHFEQLWQPHEAAVKPPNAMNLSRRQPPPNPKKRIKQLKRDPGSSQHFKLQMEAISSVTKSDKSFEGPTASTIMALERTVLSAYNMAFNIMMVGCGLMAVGAKNDDMPSHLGTGILGAGIFYGLAAYYVHYSRLSTFHSGGKISMQSSLVWIGALMLFVTIGMGAELYFAILYPYLQRAQEVNIASEIVGSGGLN